MPRKLAGAGTDGDGPQRNPKSSTDYMREMRQRLKDAGLVKREFWIRPENVDALRGIEKALRQPFLGTRIKLEDYMTEHTHWTLGSLHKSLAELELVTQGHIDLAFVDSTETGLRLILREYGDLPVYLAVVGDQVLADTTLIETRRIKDTAAFNEVVLRSRDMFPLSSVGIERLADGEEVYCLFGALSAASSLTVIVQEILTLADNVIRAAEAFEDHFTD